MASSQQGFQHPLGVDDRRSLVNSLDVTKGARLGPYPVCNCQFPICCVVRSDRVRED